jgi:hypothetical protein
MTVYVDDMHRYAMGNYGRMRMSHMIADTDDEVHAMAARIGVARKWYQGDHYDICRSMREKAVKAGAVEITIRQLGAMARLKKFGLPMGEPETAVERLIEATRARADLRARSTNDADFT